MEYLHVNIVIFARLTILLLLNDIWYLFKTL